MVFKFTVSNCNFDDLSGRFRLFLHCALTSIYNYMDFVHDDNGTAVQL